MRQHLTAVQTAARICGAQVRGATLGSSTVDFEPGPVQPGEYHVAIGTAGSTGLVLQTLLPALVTARGPTRIVLEGGTHNPMAPPFDFLHDAYLPVLRQMGAQVTAKLIRPGFFPAGGGRVEIAVEPTTHLKPIELLDAGPIRARRGRAVVAGLPEHIGHRERTYAREHLGWPDSALTLESLRTLSFGASIC